MKLSDKKGVRQIVSALAALGLREVVLCPGSRDAPFILSFHRHGNFHCTSIRDERSAAFIALGKIIELRQPVAIVCTSGSAALNFAPAIAEAFYQRLPLVVITADRPKAWTGQGDGQTINQTNIYQNHIRASFELNGDAFDETSLWHNARCISEGWAIATLKDPGPVHFNIPLNEPLYEASEGKGNVPRIFKATPLKTVPTAEAIQSWRETFEKSEKVMVLAGQHEREKGWEDALKKIASFENTVVLTESTSNATDEHFVAHIDRCISTMHEDQKAFLMPDLLITVGGAVISKRIKAMLRKYSPRAHWNVDPFDAMMDTYQSLTEAINMQPTQFLEILIKNVQPQPSGYRLVWLDRNKKMQDGHEVFLKDCRYSDLLAFHQVFKKIPERTFVHLSNSSPVRYAQLFQWHHIAGSWSNRGTSGIDGCTSTVLGAASASPGKDFLLITGDVAFHYDINGLWNEENVSNLKIIVINNGGGGIFRIISGKEAEPEMEQFFETAMQGSAEKIAAHFGWDYLAARNEAALMKALETFFKLDSKKVILEIFTDAKTNPEVLDAYWKFLKEKS